MKLLNSKIILLAIFCVCEVNTLNILGIFPYEGKSHFFVFKPYLSELAKRGHNVTVISHFPQNSPPNNYHDISIAGKSEILEDVLPLVRSYLSIVVVIIYLMYMGTENCKLLLANENVQHLWKSKSHFDLVIVEEFNSDCGKGLAYKLGSPTIGITSHAIMPWYFRKQGIPYNPSYESFMFLEGGTRPTLYQRIERAFFYTFSNILYKYYEQRTDQNTLARYFDDLPPLEELSRQTKLTLVYKNFALMGSSLTPSNLIEVGGYHVSKPKPLPDDIRKFIEESEHGVIYISFGSMLRAASTSVEIIQIIIDAVSTLPQRVIWKWEEPTLPGNPKNIKLGKWLPQNDILAHPKVLAFYSHCGLLGTTEAIHHGVPIVAMPIFGDQPLNAAAVEENGLGIQIQLGDLNVKNLLATFKAVLDPRFRENVKNRSRLWHDRPMTAMDSAVYWTEFAARHPNVNLRTRSADVPDYQFFNIDILFVSILFVVIMIIVIKCLQNLIRKDNMHMMSKKSKKD